MSQGWDASAQAWIASLGDRGDHGRRFVLDGPMMARLQGRRFDRALDLGCGEGRFCRMLKGIGIDAVGLDPTAALIEEARRRDPDGDYRLGRAEQLEIPDRSFDLVVSYLTLIEIPEIGRAIAEMARVLEPGGTLLIATMTSFATAGGPTGWVEDHDGTPRFCIDHYLEERAEWVSWRGIRVQNWHRPLGLVMSLLLSQALTLTHFSEPAPQGGDPDQAARYRRVPFFMLMEWRKPSA